jgi:hypothetical protein
MKHVCQHCGNEFESEKAEAKFCSHAHRQAAYRVRVKAEHDTPDTFAKPAPIDTRTPAEKAIYTKHDQSTGKRCLNCFEYFQVNGLQHRRKFCSDACKQAHYRLNHPEKYAPKRTTTPLESIEIKIHENLTEIVKEAWLSAVTD